MSARHADRRPRGLRHAIAGMLLVVLGLLSLVPWVVSWVDSRSMVSAGVRRRLTVAQSRADRKALGAAERWSRGLVPWNADQRRAVDDRTYMGLLSSPGDTTLGVIRIPKAGVTLPIRHGADTAALSTGAGHLYGTPLPVPGTRTTSVVAAHRGYGPHRMFLDIDRLKTGDVILIDTAGQTETYRVTGQRVIDPTDTRWLGRKAPDTLTLLTCTPVGLNTQRLLVTARLRSVRPHAGSTPMIPWQGPLSLLPPLVPLLAALVGILMWRLLPGGRGTQAYRVPHGKGKNDEGSIEAARGPRGRGHALGGDDAPHRGERGGRQNTSQ